MRVQGVAITVARHVQPVHAAHELAPAEHLADEAFHRVQRRQPLPPRPLGGAAHRQRVEQAEVERGRHQRVEQHRVAGAQEVLPVAERFQPLGQEMVQRQRRLLRGDRQGEVGGIAEMVAEAVRHQRHHRLGDRVRREARGRRRPDPGRHALAVLAVVVPASADRRVVLHQHGVAAAHRAVEELHARRRASLRPVPELAQPAQEPVVVEDLHRDAGALLPAGHLVEQAPLAGGGDQHAVRTMRRHGAQHLAAQAVGVVRVVQRGVGDAYAAMPQPGCEVPHAGQHQHDLLLVVSDIGALVAHLGHQHHVADGIDVVEGGKPVGQLVAQHQAQHAAAHR